MSNPPLALRRTGALLAGLLMVAAAQAADLLDDVKQRGQLRVAVEGTYPPFNFKDEQGKLTGFDVEIAEAIAAKLGVKASFSPTEWSAILAGLQAGKYDVIVNQVAATDKRLVPYGAMTATFYTGVGCLLGPSVLYVTLRAIVGG